jgi:hypothetical protein
MVLSVICPAAKVGLGGFVYQRLTACIGFSLEDELPLDSQAVRL